MAEYVTLLGAEEVGRAGRALVDAADTINRASSSFYDTTERLVRALDEHAARFEDAVQISARASVCLSFFDGVPTADVEAMVLEKAQIMVLTPTLQADAEAFARGAALDGESLEVGDAP